MVIWNLVKFANLLYQADYQNFEFEVLRDERLPSSVAGTLPVLGLG
jgi:hypothetical protein